jgi:hypothetical protein
MAAEIKPGQWVTVKVTSKPRALAGRKTLVRLFEQDPAVRSERRRLAKTRPPKDTRRGGRIWICRPPRLDIVKMDPGSSYKIFASVSVLRDLKSVESYVQIAPAKK